VQIPANIHSFPDAARWSRAVGCGSVWHPHVRVAGLLYVVSRAWACRRLAS
jgi:hypothetical protein